MMWKKWCTLFKGECYNSAITEELVSYFMFHLLFSVLSALATCAGIQVVVTS